MKKWMNCKLPRGWKIVRNLAAALLLAALALLLWGWPAWMADGAYRRLETELLLAPSQTVLTNRAADGSFTAYLSQGEDWIAVGRVTAVSYGGLPFPKAEPCINHLFPKAGLVVAALSGPGEGGTLTVAVWGAPEEAVSGTLELNLIDVDGGVWPTPAEETFTAQARRREDGWFIFQFAPHDNHREGQSCAMEMLLWYGAVFRGGQMEQPYRLTLTDARGKTVAEQEGTLPPDQRLQQWR